MIVKHSKDLTLLKKFGATKYYVVFSPGVKNFIIDKEHFLFQYFLGLIILFIRRTVSLPHIEKNITRIGFYQELPRPLPTSISVRF